MNIKGDNRNEIKVTYEGEYIKVIVNGEKDLEFSRKVWSVISPVCEKNNCNKVYCSGFTSKTHTINEAFELTKVFLEFNITYPFKVAWVELNPQSYEMIRFIGNVLANRGFPVKIFPNEPEALSWLLQ